MDLLLGIDAGTSVIKVVAFDLQGNQIAVAAKAIIMKFFQTVGLSRNLNELGQTLSKSSARS